jgi:hypothetical protein
MMSMQNRLDIQIAMKTAYLNCYLDYWERAQRRLTKTPDNVLFAVWLANLERKIQMTLNILETLRDQRDMVANDAHDDL